MLITKTKSLIFLIIIFFASYAIGQLQPAFKPPLIYFTNSINNFEPYILDSFGIVGPVSSVTTQSFNKDGIERSLFNQATLIKKLQLQFTPTGMISEGIYSSEEQMLVRLKYDIEDDHYLGAQTYWRNENNDGWRPTGAYIKHFYENGLLHQTLINSAGGVPESDTDMLPPTKGFFYEYDDFDNLIAKETWNPDSRVQRYTTYHTYENNLLTLEESPQSSKRLLRGSYIDVSEKTAYAYNSQGLLTQKIFYSTKPISPNQEDGVFNEEQPWRAINRRDYLYDESNKLNRMIFTRFITSSNNVNKEEISRIENYDDGRLVSTESFEDSRINTKRFYLYENNKPIQYLGYSWGRRSEDTGENLVSPCTYSNHDEYGNWTERRCLFSVPESLLDSIDTVEGYNETRYTRIFSYY